MHVQALWDMVLGDAEGPHPPAPCKILLGLSASCSGITSPCQGLTLPLPRQDTAEQMDY